MFYEILVGTFGILSVLLYVMGTLRAKRPIGFPPGPTGVPFFGNFFQTRRYPHKVAIKMEERYGNIIGWKLGSHWCVVLNNPDDIRELFSKNELTGKAGYNSFLQQHVKEVNCGETWEQNRSFCMRTLCNTRFGKRFIESIIMEEVRETVDRLEKTNGEHISTETIFNPPVFNVMWSIITGERFPHDDPKLLNIVTNFDTFTQNTTSGYTQLLMLFPGLVALKNKFPFLFPKSNQSIRKKLFDLLRDSVEEHRRAFQDGDPRDFIDSYLLEQRKNEDLNSFDDEKFLFTLMDLLTAGSAAMTRTLAWSFVLLGLHPEVQEKLFTELEIVAENREVTLADKSELPYVEAVTLEILRMSSVVPLSPMHYATEEITFKGYRIPKSAGVFANIYATNFSPKLWVEPLKFNPERFLSVSPDGKSVVKPKHWMPFGVGNRCCSGEVLARNEFFLFVTHMVQSLKKGIPDEEPRSSHKDATTSKSSQEPHWIVSTGRR